MATISHFKRLDGPFSHQTVLVLFPSCSLCAMYDGSQSTASSIDVWLDAQPDLPQYYECAHPRTFERKRRAPQSSTHRKRQHLMEVTGNAIHANAQSPGRKLRRREGQKAPPSPTRKDPLMKPVGQPFTIDPVARRDASSPGQDPEQTPRAKSTVNIPSLRPRPPNPGFDPPASPSQASGDSTATSSNHTDRSRSRSPTKRLGDLQFSDMPVDARAWSTSTVPTDLQDLVKDMKRIAKGRKVIPSGVRGKFEATGVDLEDDECKEEDGKETEEQATGGLGHELFWHLAGMIRQATNECLVEHEPEPSWNSEVHSRILRLAFEGYWKEREIWYEDIASAKISNRSLLPWNISTEAMQSKMVDYAIVIKPSREFSSDASQCLHSRIIEKLRPEKGGASINQTASEWVRFKIIAVNIETKRGTVDEDRAHVHLGTWITAHFARLRRLTSFDTEFPSLPVLSVQGKRWLLMIATMKSNGRIDLIEDFMLGETDSVAGVYQVMTALRRLAQWVNDEYRPWFEREVLGMNVAVEL